MTGDDRLRRRSGERRLANEQLVQHAREAVLIAPPIDLRRARRLLRAHVGGRADDRPGLGQRLLVGVIDRARDAEIRDHGRAVRQHDVVRLDVAVHHAAAVGVAQCPRHLRDDANRLFLRQLLFPSEAVA